MTLYSYECDVDRDYYGGSVNDYKVRCKITKVAVDVRETEKCFISEDGQYVARYKRRIEKDRLDKVKAPSYMFGTYKMISLEDNTDKFLKAVIASLDTKIAEYEEKVAKARRGIAAIMDADCSNVKTEW